MKDEEDEGDEQGKYGESNRGNKNYSSDYLLENKQNYPGDNHSNQ